MEELTYRDAVARGIAQEMARDQNVVFLGEDIASAAGYSKRPAACWNGLARSGARYAHLRAGHCRRGHGCGDDGSSADCGDHVSDFLAVCWDIVANEMAKMRYMTNGQVTMPVVIRTANGAGSRFGAQHRRASRTGR